MIGREAGAAVRPAALRFGLVLALLAGPTGAARAQQEAAPGDAGGTAQVAFRGGGSNADTSAFAAESLAGMYLSVQNVTTLTLSGASKGRVFNVLFKGRAAAGNSYPMGTELDKSAGLQYVEVSAQGGDDLGGMQIARKVWISTGGTLKVVAAAADRVEVAVSATMAPAVADEQGENQARGSFAVDLRASVTNLMDM